MDIKTAAAKKVRLRNIFCPLVLLRSNLISNIPSMHKSIYRRMHLWLGIDLDWGVLMGYYGT